MCFEKPKDGELPPSRPYDHAINLTEDFVPKVAKAYPVKTGSSRSGTDERGKCDNVGLSAVCPSNEATIRSVVVAVA